MTKFLTRAQAADSLTKVEWYICKDDTPVRPATDEEIDKGAAPEGYKLVSDWVTRLIVDGRSVRYNKDGTVLVPAPIEGRGPSLTFLTQGGVLDTDYNIIGVNNRKDLDTMIEVLTAVRDSGYFPKN